MKANNEWIKQVTEFQEHFENPNKTCNGIEELIEVRQKLIDEECKEFDEAVKEYIENAKAYNKKEKDAEQFTDGLRKSLENMLDAICDMTVINIGTANLLGFDMEEAMRRVHASNMSKLGEDGKPIYREDGKVLKGPNYFKPQKLYQCISGIRAKKFVDHLEKCKEEDKTDPRLRDVILIEVLMKKFRKGLK